MKFEYVVEMATATSQPFRVSPSPVKKKIEPRAIPQPQLMATERRARAVRLGGAIDGIQRSVSVQPEWQPEQGGRASGCAPESHARA